MEQTQERKHAQRLKDTTSPSPAVPYNEPQWSGLPVEPHTLTVIKNGTVVQEVNVSTKAFHVFGRLPTCDVPLEHPSISRHHAILQFRPHSGETPPHAGAHHTLFSTNPQESGFYIYDLGSTHGTFLNKTKVQPRCYYRMRVGQMVRFGGSSRLFVLEVCELLSLYIERGVVHSHVYVDPLNLHNHTYLHSQPLSAIIRLTVVSAFTRNNCSCNTICMCMAMYAMYVYVSCTRVAEDRKEWSKRQRLSGMTF